MKITQKTRNEIPDEYKWNLADLCPNTENWHNRIATIKEEIAEFKYYQGILNHAESLHNCLVDMNRIGEEMGKLYVYANMKHHEDTTLSENQTLSGIAASIYTSFSTTTSFVEPEILALGKDTIFGFMTDVPELKQYEHYLHNLLRKENHILGAEAESILAEAREVGEAAHNIFSIIQNSDIKFGSIIDTDGNEVEVTHARYRSFMESTDRRVRKDAFDVYYDAWWKQKNTLAAAYIASIKKDVFFARSRKYPSALEAALFKDNIPVEVYHNLISTTRTFLPVLHRYMALCKKVLKVTELHQYDTKAPLVEELDITIPFIRARSELLGGLKPLGPDYLSIMRNGMEKESGWIDLYENSGKRKGAYSWGAYGSHPYILMNYEEKGMDSMFTLAHELGHAVHSYLSWENQPFVYGHYPTFLAEVASSVNETMLMTNMLCYTEAPKMRAYLLSEYIKQFLSMIFRQVMLAEFEHETHAMAERGEPLTLEILNRLYRTLHQEYYGPDLVHDEVLDLGWAHVPHFYRAFYVYQYATGFSAAVAFSGKLLGTYSSMGDQEAYLDLLKSGGSVYPIDALKMAGVDLSKSLPVSDALGVFEGLVGALGRLLL